MTVRKKTDLIVIHCSAVGKLEDQVGNLRRWQALIIGAFTAASSGLTAAVTKYMGH